MRVPTYRRQTERTNQIGGRTFTVQASPGALSAGARAASEFFDQATNVAYGFAVEKERAERETQVMQGSTEYQLEVQKISNEVLGKGLPIAESKAELQSLIADAQKRILGGNYERYDGSTAKPISNRRAVEYLRSNVFPKYDFAAIEGVDKEITKRIADDNMAEFNRANTVDVQQAAFATNAVERQVILDNIEQRINTAEEAGHLTSVQAEQVRVKMRNDISGLTAATLLENIKDDPAGADRALQLAEAGKLDLNPTDIIKVKTEAAKLKNDFVKKKNNQTKSELSTLLVNFANAQDKVSNVAYLIETGNPTGDPVMDKIAEQFTPEERREIGKKIRQARKDHIDSINREEAFAENQRKKAIEIYDVQFADLEARNAPTEEYLALIQEAGKTDPVYALKKQTEYITPQGGFRKRIVQQTTPRGQEFMQSRRDRGAFSFNDLQNPIFLNEVTPDDRNKFRNEVLAAENTEVKRAMVRAQATLQLPAGFENSVMSENNPNFERAQILTRVQNRLNMGLIEAQKKQQDFDAFAVVDKIIEEETAAVDNIVGKAQREQAERAITFANELAKSYEGVPEFTNALDAYNFLVGIQDQTDPPSRVKQAKPRIPGQIEALRRRMLRE